MDNFINIKEIYENNKMNENIIKNDHIILIDYIYVGLFNQYHINKELCSKWLPIYNKINNFVNKLKNIKCLLIHDMHEYTFFNGFEGVANYCKNYKIDFIVTICKDNDEYDNLKKIVINKSPNTLFITVPHMIDTTIFKDYGEEKIYDILFYGTAGPAYPFRLRLKRLLMTDMMQKKFKIRILTYRELVEKDLSKEINKSRLCVSTCSKYEYLVKKYFEISASKSVVLGNMPKQGFDIFKNNYVRLDPEWDDAKIIRHIESAINNKQGVLLKTNRAYNIVHNNYSKDKYYKYLYFEIRKSLKIKLISSLNFNDKNYNDVI
jgi:hypothetical protein